MTRTRWQSNRGHCVKSSVSVCLCVTVTNLNALNTLHRAARYWVCLMSTRISRIISLSSRVNCGFATLALSHTTASFIHRHSLILQRFASAAQMYIPINVNTRACGQLGGAMFFCVCCKIATHHSLIKTCQNSSDKIKPVNGRYYSDPYTPLHLSEHKWPVLGIFCLKCPAVCSLWY
jgi:hypothetical protein